MWIGIDPGLSGGIACVYPEGSVPTVVAHKMPSTERDILDLLMMLKSHQPNARATLEFVRSSPQMGVASSFKFGVGYGGLRMALVAAGIPFDEATPGRWQAAMQCRSGGDKNVTKRRAQELFPHIKVTHALADALLLAEYGRRVHSSRPLPTGITFEQGAAIQARRINTAKF
jgi:crossover junction endodeoxyribonuclease RuvC